MSLIGIILSVTVLLVTSAVAGGMVGSSFGRFLPFRSAFVRNDGSSCSVDYATLDATIDAMRRSNNQVDRRVLELTFTARRAREQRDEYVKARQDLEAFFRQLEEHGSNPKEFEMRAFYNIDTGSEPVATLDLESVFGKSLALVEPSEMSAIADVLQRHLAADYDNFWYVFGGSSKGNRVLNDSVFDPNAVHVDEEPKEVDLEDDLEDDHTVSIIGNMKLAGVDEDGGDVWVWVKDVDLADQLDESDLKLTGHLAAFCAQTEFVKTVGRDIIEVVEDLVRANHRVRGTYAVDGTDAAKVEYVRIPGTPVERWSFIYDYKDIDIFIVSNYEEGTFQAVVPNGSFATAWLTKMKHQDYLTLEHLLAVGEDEEVTMRDLHQYAVSMTCPEVLGTIEDDSIVVVHRQEN